MPNYIDITIANFPRVVRLNLESFVYTYSDLRMGVATDYLWDDRINDTWEDVSGLSNQEFVIKIV